MKRMGLSSPQRMFTLVELLVVIAIVSIMASLLLPALNSARSSAWHVKCKSNLKQLGLGLMVYADDFDGKSMGTSTNVNGDTYTWMGFLSSFYLNLDHHNQSTLPYDLRCNVGRKNAYTYGMNTYFAKAVRVKGWARMPNPHSTIVVGDGGWQWKNGTHFQSETSFGTNRYHRKYRYRHFSPDGDWIENKGKMNIVFGDLHVSDHMDGDGMITRPHERDRNLNPWYPDDYCNGHPGTGGSTTP